MALEHGFGKVSVSKNHKETTRTMPRGERAKRARVQARIRQKDSKSDYIHGVCLLNHGKQHDGLIVVPMSGSCAQLERCPEAHPLRQFIVVIDPFV